MEVGLHVSSIKVQYGSFVILKSFCHIRMPSGLPGFRGVEPRKSVPGNSASAGDLFGMVSE